MTCYVDELRHYPGHRSGHQHWCHLVSDGGEPELHGFAARLGLRREWFQARSRHPHYDLPPAGRERAIELGAVPVSSRELIRLLRRARAAG
ncbi:MAG TPA: DUF4031 domain-containing protein [Thermomicrobiaceae bacterium]|nr:DUF4031 domain-containing protein [Thermomicrobiaceae bacterium]